MSLYLLLPLVALVFNLAVVMLTLRGHWRAQGNRIFAGFLLSMALWGAGLFNMRSSHTLEGAFFWDKLVVSDFAVIGVMYLHFTYRFAGLSPKRWVLPLVYGLLGLVAIATALGFTITGMQQKSYGYAPVLGTGFYLFLAFTYSLIVIGILNLLYALRSAPSPAMRNRAAYVLAGTIFSLIGATTDYLPVLGIPIYPLGIVGNILFAAMASAAMVKDHLVDIHQTLRRIMAYAVFIICVVALYLLVIVVLMPQVRTTFNISPSVITLIFVTIIALGSPYMVERIKVWIEQSYYRQRYWALKSLEQFSQQTKDIVDLDVLATSLLAQIRIATQSQFACLLQPDTHRRLFVSSVVQATELDFKIPFGPWTIIDRLSRADRVLTAQEAYCFPEWQTIPTEDRTKLEKSKVSFYVPIKSRKELTGLLLIGPKIRKDAYTQEDIDLLQTVANQAATVIENARLYQELRIQLQQLKETQAQLIQSAKLASVGTLAAGVAHEINNPVFAIAGRAEMLLEDPERHLKTPKSREYVSVILERTQRIASIVRELLAFARRDDSFAPVDLSSVVKQTLILVENDLKVAGIKINQQYDQNLPSITGNRSKLQQVIMNLLMNAKDAMPGGGSLTISIKAEDGHVGLSFTDTGVGIPADRLSHIFDAFYTTKEAGKGTGLGLFICQRIVDEHKGRIIVQSVEKVGTTFTLSIPALSFDVVAEFDLEDRLVEVGSR